MNRKYKLAFFAIVPIAVGLLVAVVMRAGNVPVLDPQGLIADKQRNLLIFASLLSLLVVVPVFALTFFIAWKYRASNTKAKYTPEWDHSRVLETIWWTVPLLLIVVLSVVTWNSSHDLDPFKKISAAKQPITVQVVALNWKWLFIYPEQHIATVNYVQFPEKTPVNFQITADAPMNSFWIPSLGGQMYAMAGMSTELNLMADGLGSYRGSSANISGEGFAGMKFVAKSSSEADFRTWVNQVKQAPSTLDVNMYKKLALPSKNNAVAYYTADDQNLYDKVVMKYRTPMSPLRDDRAKP